jgi:hypothetical protein
MPLNIGWSSSGKHGPKRKMAVNVFDTLVGTTHERKKTCPSKTNCEDDELSEQAQAQRAHALREEGNQLAEEGKFSEAVRTWKLALTFSTTTGSTHGRAILQDQIAQVRLRCFVAVSKLFHYHL